MEITMGIIIALLLTQIILTGLTYRQLRLGGGAKFTTELPATPPCNHKWRIENKDTIPSAWGQLAKGERTKTDPQEWLFKSVIATTYICILCGEMRTEKVTTVRDRDGPES